MHYLQTVFEGDDLFAYSCSGHWLIHLFLEEDNWNFAVCHYKSWPGATVSAAASQQGSTFVWRKKIRWGTGGKMLIAVSLDTATFLDKSHWWTWRRMPGREWKSDMTPEKGSRRRLQQAIFFLFLFPMLYQLAPQVPLVSFFSWFLLLLLFFRQSWIFLYIFEDRDLGCVLQSHWCPCSLTQKLQNSVSPSIRSSFTCLLCCSFIGLGCLSIS